MFKDFGDEPVPVYLPENINREQLEAFPAFNTWKTALTESLAKQSEPNHAFHDDPYILRKITIQSVDWFGPRIGFVKLNAEIKASKPDGNGRPKMLPGISAEDYMFADLEFDPCVYGCMTCEATEFLLRNRSLNPSTHNIIWQVGSVGVSTMAFDVCNRFLHFSPIK